MDAPAHTAFGEREIHEALANREHRRIISILQDAAEPLALADIAIELAEREGLEGEEMWERAHGFRIQLYHYHLPKLDEVDLVEYDRDRAVAWVSEFEAESTLATEPPLQ